ncbi:SLC13 family permease [Oceanicoccus sagamiensis]|uniref:SLC13 family permease n=1 Tax=Oceanicoccus sagamiensis TaxID=716816 RepID=A0A1X9N8Y8_9GAMM|nr:SLC13 family permease [Oceanicoccus sagamiensis]ARN72902.1 SLC13 family permease [Oceanicoccus sagamiensis]
MALTPEAFQTLAVIAFCFGLLVFSRYPADAILVAGVALLTLLNIITAEEALVGMSNEGMATVAVLFVVARGLAQTGVVGWVSNSLLGRPKNTAAAQLRLMLPVSAMSTVLNNTPVVAMMVPAVADWAKRNNLNVSQLMMPLSYAAIVGGTCTLVGSSTNLVINGMLTAHSGDTGLRMFDLAWVGVPCVIVVTAFTIAFSRWLLPHRGEKDQQLFGDAREYIVEMEIESDSPLVGKSIEEAGLRQLPGMFLVEIDRDGRLITAVAPNEMLLAGDHLIFAGDVRSVVDLKNIHGLKVAEKQVFKLNSGAHTRCLVEVVISRNFPQLGKSIKDMRFRNLYSAAIIAVARDGERIKTKIGDIYLKPGDTLLLETHDRFVNQQRYSKNFLLVSEIENSRPVRHEQRNLAAAIMLAMVISVAVGFLSMFKAALLAAGLMILTRCIKVQDARESVNWQVILVIAASIGLGGALEKTGAATVIAETMIGLTAHSPVGVLITLFVLTAAFSAVVSNLAAAVLIFPIAIAASQQLDVNLLPFAVTVMIAASACFATPIGYQTNLMVYGPGNYRFGDFMKIGLPLTVMVGITTVLVVPMVWSF